MILPMMFQAAQSAAQSAQVAVQQVSQESGSATMLSGALIYFAQKWLKGRSFYDPMVKAVPGADKWAHRGIAFIGTLIAVLGIHLTLTGNSADGWQFAASVPPVAKLVESVIHGIEIFTFQQFTYEVTRKDRP